MNRSTIVLLFVLILATGALAQNAVNTHNPQRFNGTWIFDGKKSDVGTALEDLYKGQTLEISYDEPQLKITKTQTMNNDTRSVTLIFYTDNRGEKNRPFPFNGALELESHTTWDMANIVTSYTIKMYKSGKDVGGDDIRETYTVSEDGNTLTIIEESRLKMTDSLSARLRTSGKGKMKKVYTRMK